eukprot:Skav210508  [mRNA]  locus=scaffold601:521191:528122:- [translate_table: standard]
MAWSLSNSEMAEVREAFLELDQDKKGTIELHELRTVLEDRFNIADEETRKIFAALDASNHDEVRYSEFLAAMMTSRIEVHEALVRTAFKRFDKDDSGYITVPRWSSRRRLVPQFVDDNRLSYDEFIEYLISGEAQERVQAAASLVIDKQMSLLSSELQASSLTVAPLQPKSTGELRYGRSKSFHASRHLTERTDSDEEEKGPQVARHRTAPAPTPTIKEATESVEAMGLRCAWWAWLRAKVRATHDGRPGGSMSQEAFCKLYRCRV